MTKKVKINEVADHVTKLPSMQNNALEEMIRGLYQGKPLFWVKKVY